MKEVTIGSFPIAGVAPALVKISLKLLEETTS